MINRIRQHREERAATATVRADAAYKNQVSAAVHAMPPIAAVHASGPALKR